MPGRRGHDASRRFRLLLFTSDPAFAAEAAAAGVDGIVLDWERRDKHRRQAEADTEINQDTAADLRAIRAAVDATVLCRIDAFGRHTAEQIDDALACGADEILLPMVRTPEDVETALLMIGGRARLGILVETVDAVRRIAELAELPVAHAYIGLNDLAIERGTSNIFTALVDGTAGRVCTVLAEAGIPHGFGGLTLPDRGEPVPCRLLMAELTRLGCDFSFLRRSFRRDTVGRPLGPAVARMRAALSEMGDRTTFQIRRDRHELRAAVLGWEPRREASLGA